MTRAIDAGHMLRFIIRRWLIFVITLVISVVIGYISNYGSAADMHSAKTVIYCPIVIPYEENSGIKAIKVNSGIINSEKIADEARLRLSYNISSSSLRRSVKISSNLNSAVYDLTALSDSPERAVEAANAMADAFIREGSGYSGI